MKTIISKSLILAALMISFSTYMSAQKRNPKPMHREEAVEKVTAVNGVVNEWIYNDDFIYDGFTLQSGNEELFVKIPKHMGKVLRNSIAKNNITVNGVVKYSPEGNKELKWVSIVTNGKNIYDIPKERPEQPPVEKFVNGSGKVLKFQQNERGDTHGIFLDNKTLLRIPAHKFSLLSSLLQTGKTIQFTGFEKPKNEDEAVADNYSVIKLETLTVDGEQYLIK
ncbi:hypothetical protein O2K51_00670 [Apibacter raozihei]|uniref:hypothetical protein n=1 Tax=Apibacter raozihei TaxID=2500547 RepID=UPI000FE2DF06|nr:hypothetical protein [Apibacter raozihei]